MECHGKENADILRDLIRESRQDISDFRREVKEDNRAAQERLSSMERTSDVQNQQLAEHIRRTNLLEDLHKDNASRIERLEVPKKVFGVLTKWIIGLSALGASIATIIKMLQ